MRQFLITFTVFSLSLSTALANDDLEKRRVAYKALRALDTQAKQLEESLDEIQAFHVQLTQKTERTAELVTRIEDLQAEAELFDQIERELDKWSTASLVLGNANTGRAIAVRFDSGTPEVTAVSQHPFSTYAIMAATRARVPRDATPRATNILASYFSQPVTNPPSPFGKEEAALVGNLRESVLAFSTDARFMVYRDPVANRQRVAFINGDGDDSLPFTLSEDGNALAKQALVGGSAFVGGPDEIESHIEVGQPFLDYCALSVLHSLFRVDNKRESPSIAMAVVIGNDVQNQTGTGRTRYFDRYASEHGVRQSSYGIGRSVVNELQVRLSRRHVHVVAREFADLLYSENSIGQGINHLAQQSPEEATHLLVLNIESPGDARSHIAVRLIDRVSQNTIWAATDKSSLIPSRTWTNFLVQSGQPHLVTFTDNGTARMFSGSKDANSSDEFVAIAESHNDKYTVLRKMYQADTIRFDSHRVSLSPIEKDDKLPEKFLNGRLREDLMPYLAYRFGRHLLAPASTLRDIKKSEAGFTATVGVGSRHSLVPGDRFRMTDLSRNQLLPTVAALADVLSGDKGRLHLPAWSLDQSTANPEILAVCDTWHERRVCVFVPGLRVDNAQLNLPKHFEKRRRLLENARAIRNALRERLFQAMVSAGVATEAGKLEYAIDQNSVFRRSREFATQKAQFYDILDEDKMVAQAKNMGATHVIGGSLRRVKYRTWEITLGLYELNITNSGETSLGKSVESVTFLMSEPDWLDQ